MDIELETPRLSLRAQRLEDVPAFLAGLNDWEVVRWLTVVPYPYTVDDMHDWVRRRQPIAVGTAHFAIERRGIGTIGVVSLESDLGYWLAREYHGHGYMTEACGALLEWHFAARPDDVIASGYHVGNEASAGVQKKLGFVETGERRMRFVRSQQRDVEHIGTSLTRVQFEAAALFRGTREMDVSLRTRRLLLRPPQPGDASRIARLLNNFRVAGNLSRVPYPYSEADAVGWLKIQRHDHPPECTGFTLELPGEGPIGHCGFHPDVQGTVIGYWLGEPFWNRGFMTEAAAAILDWYFTVTSATHVGSGVFHFNRASLAVQKKLGFTETGSSFRLCLARKQEVRHIDTELTRALWERKQAS